MTAISKPIAPAVLQNQLRPFDVRRDLSDVADLVELCFADTLDMDGREYLARMRSAARDTSLLRMAKGWASVPMTGYVWHEDDRLVGNISLISYIMKGRRFFLIANVAVHPNYRRRGIARHMTEAAVEHARLRSAPAVWLHVREENQPAQELYASLGFKERAVRTTWTGRPGEKLKPTLPPRSRFITPRSAHWPQFSPWLKESYPPELSWHMSFQLNSLRPGLSGGVIPPFPKRLCLRVGGDLGRKDDGIRSLAGGKRPYEPALAGSTRVRR